MEISSTILNKGSVAATEQGEKGRDLSEWLPITADRSAKWWFSAFHNVTAMVGAGVLGLPFAVSQLGWIPGISVIFVSWLVTFYSLWQLVGLHEVVPGRRFDRYRELGQYVFGPKLGYWIIMPQQLLVQVASNIVYMVTGGKSLKKSIDILVTKDRYMFRQTYYIMFFGVVHLCLSQIPNFNSLKEISLVAAIMSFSYSMVAFGASTAKGCAAHGHVSHGIRAHTTTDEVFGIMNALGTIAFAYAGHSVVLEIQATIPSTPSKPSKQPMWRGVVVAYIIVAFCYLTVAISGFWAFGDLVEDDVLISLENPSVLIAIANFMVFVHVIGSYQVFAMPVFDILESFLVQKLHFAPGLRLRLIARSSYVVLTALVAICIPFFGGLLGFFGGLVFASTSYIIPCIMWLIVHKPPAFSLHWTASWVTIFIGLVIAILAPIGGMRQIILSASSYEPFS